MTTVLATKVYLSGGTFSNCKNITSVNCHNTPFVNNTAAFGYNGAFANCNNLTNVSELNSKTNSLYQTFYNCSNLTIAPIIPNSVNTMYYTFYNCRNMASLANNVLTVNAESLYYAFGSCINLSSPITIYSPNTKSFSYTFSGCSNLTDVNIYFSKNMQSTQGIFSQCPSLTNLSVTYEDIHNTPNYKYATSMFSGCSNLATFPQLPNTIIWAVSMYSNCKKLINCILPTSVVYASGVFSGCSNLTTATVPNSIVEFQGAYSGCSNLTTATIPQSVCGSLSEICYNCTNLTNVIGNIPTGVNSLEYAFKNCTNLSGDIYIDSENIENANNIFNGTSLTKNVYIPFKTTEDEEKTLYCWVIEETSDKIYIKEDYSENEGNTTKIYNADGTINYNYYEGYFNYGQGYVYSGDWEEQHAVYSPEDNEEIFVPAGSYTETYNAFNDAGYMSGIKDGVIIKNSTPIGETKTITINPSISGTTVELICPGFSQEGNSITVEKDSVVTYKVSKNTYYMEQDDVIADDDKTINVSLTTASYQYKIDTRKKSSSNKVYVVPFVTSTNAAMNAWIATGETVTINWGDGSTKNITGSFTATDCTHTYSSAGVYTITITTNGTHMPNFTPGYTSTYNVCVTEVLTPLITIAKQNGSSTAIGGLDHIYYYANITTLPENVFKYNKDIENLNSMFYGSKITTVPSKLFNGLKKINSAYSIFQYCNNLVSLPDELFKDNPLIGSWNASFADCPNLEDVPDDLFEYITAQYYTGYLFMNCSKLKSIPTSTYKNQTNISGAFMDFQNCRALTSIPVGLFDDCANLVNVEKAFAGCSSLETIPDGLFQYNTKLKNFQDCFSNCPKLKINKNIFGNESVQLPTMFANKDEVCFKNMFYRSTFTGSEAGTAPQLWNYQGPSGTKTMYGWKFPDEPDADWYTDSATPQPGDEMYGYYGDDLVMGTSVGHYDSSTGILYDYAEQAYNRDTTIDKNYYKMDGRGCFGGSGNTNVSIDNYANIPSQWINETI